MKGIARLLRSKKPGFTLIESLSVIAIIGILASLSIYTITQAQRQARDTVRKSDVSAISQGFEARALDKTCTDQSAVGLYPGEDILNADTQSGGRMLWHPVEDLNDSVDRCNPFGVYLSTIPNDPKTASNKYYFNLSSSSDARAQHYRVAAKLEKDPSDEQWREICRQSNVWYDEFGGERYDDCPGDTIGFAGESKETSLLGAFLGRFAKPAYACVFNVGTGEWEGCDTPDTGGGTGTGTGGGSTSGGNGSGGPTACENEDPTDDPGSTGGTSNCNGTGGGSTTGGGNTGTGTGGGNTGGGSTGTGTGTNGEDDILPYNYYVGR